MTSRSSRGAANNMFGFSKVNNSRKRNSALLDNSLGIGSVGNSISNENNALLASQAAMAVLYKKSSTTAPTAASKTRTSRLHKKPNSSRIKTVSRNEKLPITKITVLSEAHHHNGKPELKRLKRRKEEVNQKQPPLHSNNKLNSSKVKQKNAEEIPISYESLKAHSSKVFSAEASPNYPNNEGKDSAKGLKRLNAKANLDIPYHAKSAAGHGLSNHVNDNGSSGASLSALAATKALTEFQKAEILTENDNETMFQKHLEQESKKDSFHLVNQPRKLTIEEEIQEQIYNDDLLKNLVKDKAEALKINTLTSHIAIEVLKNYEHGTSDNNEKNNILNEYAKQVSLSDRKFVEVEQNEESKKPSANDSEIKFNVLQVKRRPPPLNETKSISRAILPKIDTYLNSEEDEPIHRTISDRESQLSDAAYSDISSLLPTPIQHKTTFRSISDPVFNQNLGSIKKTRSRAITISDKSTPATIPDNKSPTTRTKRSHTISSLFKDILSSSNSTASSGNITPTPSSAKACSPTGINKESHDHKGPSPNILKRTIRSLSLSINNAAVDKSDTIVKPTDESQRNANSIPVEEKAYSGNARPEYSVLKNKKLPSYYQSRNDLNTHGNGNDNSIQFKSTLRGEALPSKRSKLKSYMGLGHSDAADSHKHSLFGKRMSLSKDSNDRKVMNTNDNESVKSNSEYPNNNSSALAHYDSYSSADDTNNSDDMMSNFETPTDLTDEKPHNNNHKADLFLKIPAKLAYKSMKKHTDNWEFHKGKTFKKALIQEERRLGLKDDDASFVTNDNTSSSIQDTSQQSIQSESPYILGLHSRSKRSNKFDENKPWKSHIDLGYITSEEKKRYEGIWVSNKNRFLDMLQLKQPSNSQQISPNNSPNNQSTFSFEGETPTISSSIAIPIPSYVALGAKAPKRASTGQFRESEDLMVNFVVYEIFNRSNLPPRLLAQIYSLIDLRHDGTITKKSFIVGMWLIDQCLYGKKLPAAIPDLVWDSVDKMVIGVDVSHKSLQRNKKRNARREIKELKRHEKFVKETIKKEQHLLEQ